MIGLTAPNNQATARDATIAAALLVGGQAGAEAAFALGASGVTVTPRTRSRSARLCLDAPRDGAARANWSVLRLG